MREIVRILFSVDNYYLPQLTGGTEISIDAMCNALRRHGITCAVSAALGKTGATYVRNRLAAKLLRRPHGIDTRCGYAVYRDWSYQKAFGSALEHFLPNIVVLMKNSQPLLRSVCEKKIPTLVYLQDVYFKDLSIEEVDLGRVKFVANSKFTREKFQDRFRQTSVVLPPLVEPEKYATQGLGSKVLFVNPHPMKGLEIALSLFERNPNIPFLMVDSWPITSEARKDLRKRLANLSNVEWLICQRDMQKIYAQTRLVIMPSQCDESWGRVATEAQISGIPVLASRRGGLTESVGPGGVLVEESASVEAWDRTLKSVWNDQSLLKALSDAARRYSRRSEIHPESVMARLIELGESCI